MLNSLDLAVHMHTLLNSLQMNRDSVAFVPGAQCCTAWLNERAGSLNRLGSENSLC